MSLSTKKKKKNETAYLSNDDTDISYNLNSGGENDFTYEKYKEMKEKGQIKFDTDIVQGYFSEAQNLFSDVDNNSANPSYGWAVNSGKAYSDTINNLSDDEKYVELYLNSIKDSDTNTYDSLSKQFEQYKTALSQTKDYINNLSGFASQYDNEDEYNKGIFEIQAREKVKGKSYDELMAASRNTDNKYVSNWLKDFANENVSLEEITGKRDKALKRQDEVNAQIKKYMDLERAADLPSDKQRYAALLDPLYAEADELTKEIKQNGYDDLIKQKQAEADSKKYAEKYKGLDFNQLLSKISDKNTDGENEWLEKQADSVASSEQLRAKTAELTAEVKHINNELGSGAFEGEEYTEKEKQFKRASNALEKYKDLQIIKQREEKAAEYEKLANSPDFAELSKGEWNHIDANDKMTYMTSEEQGIYNYLRNSGKEDEADEYINLIDRRLNERFTQANKEWAQNYATDHPWLASAMSLGSNLISGAGIVEDIGKRMVGEPIDVNSPMHYGANLTNALRSTVSDKYLGDVGVFGYDTVMSAADSAVNMAVASAIGGAVGAVAETAGSAAASAIAQKATSTTMSLVMGSQVATNTVIDAKERGLTDDQAVTLGVLYGIAETISEKYSIEKWMKDPVSVGSVLKKSFIAEGTEEIAANWLDRLADYLVAGDKSQINQKYKDYINQGFSDKEALTMTLFGMVGEDTTSFLAGGLSGLAMSGAHMAAAGGLNEIQSAKAEHKSVNDLLKPENKDALNKLIKAGKEFDEDSDNYKLAERIEKASADGEKISTKDVKKLRRAVVQQAYKDTAEDIKKLYSVTEGFDDEERAAVGYLGGKLRRGQSLTNQENAMIRNDSKILRAVSSFIEKDENDVIDMLDAAKFKDNFKYYSSNGNGLLEVDGNEFRGTVEIKSTNPANGRLTLNLIDDNGNSRTISSDDVDFKNDTEAKLYSIAANFSNPNEANAFVENYEGGDLTDYLTEWNLFSNYGRLGYNRDQIYQRSQLDTDTKVRQAAYYSGMEAFKSFAQVQYLNEQAYEAAAQSFKGYQRGTFVNNVSSERLWEMSRAQRKSIRELKMFTFAGLNVELFESKTDKNGNFIGENGSFDAKTKTLRVDINAGFENNSRAVEEATRAYIRLTAAHELTHAAEQGGGYMKLRAEIVRTLEAAGFDYKKLVDKKFNQLSSQDKYKGIAKDKLYRLADEETIADCCETLLNDSKVFEKLFNADKTLAEKFINAVKRAIEKLRQFFKENPTYARTEYGKALQEAMSKVENRVQELWDEAVAQGIRAENNISNNSEKINTPNEKSSDRFDTDYLSAIERGDMATAQKMVDEAAMQWNAYSVDGKSPLKVYHGTLKGGFNKFGGRHDYWYFSNSKEYSNVFAGYKENGEPSHLLKTDTEHFYNPKIYEAYLKIQKPFITDDIDIIEDAFYWDRALPETMRSQGYDALMLKDLSQIIVLYPENIKSADPVTYDDDGNVIPLSERFNEEKEDIRYSDREKLSSNSLFIELSESGKQETIDVLTQLANGKAVPLERVNALELFENAFSRRGELNETININTPQRKQLRKDILDKIEKLGSVVEKNGKVEYNGDVRREYRADIVIGLPSAGKSSVLVEPLSATYGSRVVDSDMVKEALPEFNNGLGASNVHLESQIINNQILKDSSEKGENIVLPIVGSKVEKVTRIINALKHSGYDVYLHLNELPMYKALGRMITRYIETGRFLAPDLIYQYHNKPTEVFEHIINHQGGLLSGYSKYSNDVEYGERPIFKGGTEDIYAAFSERYRKDLETRSEDLRGGRGLSSGSEQSSTGRILPDGSVKNQDRYNEFDDLFDMGEDLFEDSSKREILDELIEKYPDDALYIIKHAAEQTVENILTKTKSVKLDDDAYLYVARKFMREYNISRAANPEEDSYLAAKIKNIVARTEVGELSQSEIMNEFINAARDALLLSGTLDDSMKEEREFVLGLIKGKTLLVTDYNESNIRENYGDLTRYRSKLGHGYISLERNANKKIGGTRGVYIDEIISEIKEAYPSLIDEDANEATGFYWLERLLNDKLEPTFKSSVDSTPEIDAVIGGYEIMANLVDQKARQIVRDNKNGQKYAKLGQTARELAQEQRKAVKEAVSKVKEEERQKAKKDIKEAREKAEARYKAKLEKKEQQFKEKLDEQREKTRELRREKNDVIIAEKQKRVNDLRRLRDNRERREVIEKINKTAAKMRQMILRPTDTAYVPDEFKNGFIEVTDGITQALKLSDDTKIGQHLNKLSDLLRKLATDDRTESVFGYEFDENFRKRVEEFAAVINGKKIDKNLTLREANDIHNLLKSVVTIVRNANKLINSQERRSISEAGIQIMLEQENLDSKWLNKQLKTIKKYFMTPLRMSEIINAYNDKAVLTKLVNELNRGVRKKNMFFMVANKMFDDYREKNVKELDHSSKDVREIRWTDNAGNSRVTRMTGMQAMQICMTWNREIADDNLVHISEGGLTIFDPDQLAKGNNKKALEKATKIHGVNNSFITSVASSLTRFEKGYIDIAEQYFNEYSKDAINETSLALKHFKIANSKYYIPIKVDKNSIAKEIEGIKFDSSVENQGMFNSVVPKSRKSIYIQGLDSLINNHIQGVSNYYGLAIPIRNLNKTLNVRNVEYDADGVVVNENTVKDALNKNWGEMAINNYEQMLTDLQNSRASKGELNSKEINKFIRGFRSNFVTSVLNFNPSVTLKQAASYFTAGAYIDGSILGKGFAHFWAKYGRRGRYKALLDEIDSHTAQHYIRRQGLSSNEIADINDNWLSKAAQNTKIGRKITTSKIAQGIPSGFNPNKWIQNMDCLTTAMLWVATKDQVNRDFNKAKKEIGTDEYWQAVTDLYDKVIEDTQPMYDPLHRPEVLKSSNELVKSIFMFKTQPLQNAGIIYDALGRAVQGNKGAIRKLGKAVASQTASLVTFALMTFVVSLARHNPRRYRDENDELTVESIFDQVKEDIFTNGMGILFPFGGTEIMTMFTQDGDAVQDNVAVQLNEFIGACRDLYDTIDKHNEAMSMGLETDPQNILSALKDFAVVVSQDITGLPVNNAIKNIEGVTGWINDVFFDKDNQLLAPTSEPKNKQVAGRFARQIESGNTAEAEKILNEFYQKELEKAKADKDIKNPENKAAQKTRYMLVSAYKTEYQKAFLKQDSKQMERIARILIAGKKYMIWDNGKTSLSKKLDDWRKSAKEDLQKK